MKLANDKSLQIHTNSNIGIVLILIGLAIIFLIHTWIYGQHSEKSDIITLLTYLDFGIVFSFLMIKDNLDIVDNLFILCILFDYENVIDLDFQIFKEYIDFAHKCCFLGLLSQFYLQ